MSKFKFIDQGFDDTRASIREELEELDVELYDARKQARYHGSRYRSWKDHLRGLNNKKDRLNRQLKKVDQLQASINPKPPAAKKEGES